MFKLQLTIAALLVAILAGCNTAQQPQGELQVLTVDETSTAVTLTGRNELAQYQMTSTTGVGGWNASVDNFSTDQIQDRAALAHFLFDSTAMGNPIANHDYNTGAPQINNYQELAEFHALYPGGQN